MENEQGESTTSNPSQPNDVLKKIMDCIDNEMKNMDNLKRSPYTEGWPEEEWEQHFQKHPFFMTKSPDPTEELHPLLEGLQQLKYDESENTADELAETFKKDGLLSYKLGKYRDAITNFIAGLQKDISNHKLKAQLYNNRAASHFLIQNFRSAIQDSEEALKCDPNYSKSKIRIARCLFYLEKYEKCIEKCDDILNENTTCSNIIELRKKAAEKKKVKDRDLRKGQKKISEEKKLLHAISSRKLNVVIKGQKLESVTQLDPPPIIPNFEPPPLPRVSLVEDRLIWPALFTFPQNEIYECVQQFDENITFSEILVEIFDVIHEDWDLQKLYNEKSVNIYFRGKYSNFINVPIGNPLIQAQRHPEYVQDSGIVCFFILLRNSPGEKQFLQRNGN